MIYETDEDARDAWDAEREAFMREGEEDDLLPLPAPKHRFWIDTSGGLPVVRDRLFDGMACARFLTMWGAEEYVRRREMGQGHGPALLDAVG